MFGLGSFFSWFYDGLSGIGGWVVFLLLALAAVVWLLYDAASRHLPAPGWKVGVVVAALLLMPAILFKFGGSAALRPHSLPIFYLGILGGILPIVLAVGYYVAYQGMVGCPYGHAYEAILGSCPYDPLPGTEQSLGSDEGKTTEGVFVEDSTTGGAGWAETDGSGEPRVETDSAPPTDFGAAQIGPKIPKAPAWLVTGDGRQHQLNKGETLIGRSARNDIALIDDPLIGREHAKIVEENGVYRLYDLGSKNHTYVNDQRMREPAILEPHDKVRFGRRTEVEFVT